MELWKNGLADEAGICLQPMIRISTDPNGYPEPAWKNIVYGLQTLNEKQLKEISNEYNKKFTGGHNFVTFTCEPVRLLPYLMKRFIKAGGIFEKKKIVNFDELENFDLIVNCTGLGSKDLASDEKVIPIRGQVIRVQAPWIFQTILDESDDGHYVIAKFVNFSLKFFLFFFFNFLFLIQYRYGCVRRNSSRERLQQKSISKRF